MDSHLHGNDKQQIFSVNMCLKEHKLKKQSQFENWQIGVNSYKKGIYDNIIASSARNNKPKQSQFIRSEYCVQRSAKQI